MDYKTVIENSYRITVFREKLDYLLAATVYFHYRKRHHQARKVRDFIVVRVEKELSCSRQMRNGIQPLPEDGP